MSQWAGLALQITGLDSSPLYLRWVWARLLWSPDILWAARNPSLLVFTDEYETWQSAPDVELHLTVDRGDEKWMAAGRNEGLITQLLEKVAPSSENAVTITCGPPIMIHFVSLSQEAGS